MFDKLSEADIRRVRLQCYIAAGVFVACGVGVLLLPTQISPALRGVGAGFNLVIAIAVLIFGLKAAKKP